MNLIILILISLQLSQKMKIHHLLTLFLDLAL